MSYDLGTLIADLGAVRHLPVNFDIVDEGSYRGNYHDAFIQINKSDRGLTAGAIADYLSCNVCDVVFGGWKGGMYTMWGDVTVYVASDGIVSDTRIVGLQITDGVVSLQTVQDTY